MAGDKRETVINALLGAASLVVSAVLILCLSQESSRYERDATNRAYANARDAERQIAVDCRASVPRDRPDCVNKAVEAARENQRKEQDLAAQWVTAWWTQVTGSAAVVGVILSAFGIFLVWRTFRAAREGNEISRQAMTAENRAWIEIGELSHEDLRLEGDQIRMKLTFKMMNVGNTVALNVSGHAALIPDPFAFPDRIGPKEFRAAMLADREPFSTSIFANREEDSRDNIDASLSADLALMGTNYLLCLCLGVRYNTIFDREGDPFHETRKVLWVQLLNEDFINFYGQTSIHRDNLKTKRYPIDHSEVT